jgi:hypothetical protein
MSQNTEECRLNYLYDSESRRGRAVPIRDKLNEPKTPVERKAKLALNLLPGVITYEVELDTEKALRRVKEPIKRLFRRANEKK